jgi:hypothetical protein
MLIISKDSKARLADVRTNMQREILAEMTKDKNAAERFSVSLQGDYHTRVERIWRNFESQLVYLATYGDDPRLWRVWLSISSQPQDWNYHSVNFWHYPLGAMVHGSTMLPMDEHQWKHFMTGALVYHKHDDTWSIHT